MRKTLAVFVLLAASGCSNAYRIATVQNNHDWLMARFRETCGTPVKCSDKPECEARCVALNAEAKALHEAATALANKGGMPLQMKALKAAEVKP
jgi:hypothetical protein